jgi:SAM-dependent methyltransferase
LSDRWVWDRYWQADRIASCFDGAGATNYGDAVAAGWRDFLSDLPNGARIIDLCTGNGAIAVLAAAVSKDKDKGFSITAVDQADIDPPAYVTRNRDEMAAIEFVGQTNVEDLPFPDASFDVAISQYGIEYSDLARSLPELVRVLARGGRVRLVVHAAEGVVAKNAKAGIADADMLTNGIDLLGASRRCFEAVAAVERGDGSPSAQERAQDAFNTFRAALKRTRDYLPQAFDKVMVQNSGGVMLDAFQARHRVGYDAVFAKVDTVEKEILAHRGRIQALLDCALDEAGAEALARQLRDAGATEVTHQPLESDEGLIGHVVTARL